MFAATGNHVESLHRVAVGGLTLGDLPEGPPAVSAGEHRV
jgi:16S rRNA pseudouridine516 synthase